MDKKVRLLAITSIAVIALACGLLAIPQFIVPVNYDSLGSISGYQFFFHAVDTRYETNSHMSGVSGLGIASIVLMALALLSYLFSKKTSALVMLGGLLNIATAILFFCMEASKKHVYGFGHTLVSVGWIAYVVGALLILNGLVAVYVSVKTMMGEKKQITEQKNSYSYLKKNR